MNPTIVRLALSSLLGRARGLTLVALPGALLLICVLARLTLGTTSPSGVSGRAILGTLGLSAVVPMLALLASTRALGNEMEDGTIAYLISKPIPRSRIVLSKLVAAILVTLLLGALPMVLASLVLDQTAVDAALGWGAGATVAAVTYAALFLALSASTKHSVVWGLAYVLVWEMALGGFLSGIVRVSVRAWASRVAAEVGGLSVLASDQVGIVHALVGTGIVLVVGTCWSVRRLRALSLTGD